MVGLRLSSSSYAPVGSPLFSQGLLPLAAALSDALLPSRCSACFAPCSASRCPCAGLCHGAVGYCSPHCRDLDLPLHSECGECLLLATIGAAVAPHPPILAWRGSTSFPSLGGTCDLRAALRLLAHHEALNNTGRFLAALKDGCDVKICRLGGLLSNRFSLLLLQQRPSDDDEKSVEEEEEEEQLVAKELREAALLMHHVRYSTSLNAWGRCMAKCDCTELFRTGEHACADMDVCMARSRHKSPHTAVMTLNEETLLVDEVICQVFTNGVHVQVNTLAMGGQSNLRLDELGTAVYSHLFSWINHSCRPNAFYSFVLGGSTIPLDTLEVSLVPDMDIEGLQEAWGLESCQFPWLERADDQVVRQYGPCASLRSIENINELEAVCISYTDLLQPKNIRKMELWSKYRFDCMCERCNVTPTSYADGILLKVGLLGSQSDVSILEETLHAEAQQGLSEFLNNDNPWACCQILERALVGILQEAHQECLVHEGLQTSSQCVSRLKSLHACAGAGAGAGAGAFGCVSCPEMSKGQDPIHNGKYLKVHLMHRLCLDIYMALSSSYNVLAAGFNHPHDERPSSSEEENTREKLNLQNCKLKVSGEKAGAKCNMALAAYTLILAAAVQHLYDSGEGGLIGIAAHFWLQTGETLIRLICKLDSCFCLDTTTDLRFHEYLSRLAGDPSDHGPNPFLEGRFPSELKDFLNAHGSLIEADQRCESSIDFLRCMANLMWPLFQGSSPFLSSIVTPFDISQISFQPSAKPADNLESREVWICRRVQVFVCAVCCLQHSFNCMNICYGYSGQVVEVIQTLFNSAVLQA